MSAPLATAAILPVVYDWLVTDATLVALVAESPTGGPGIYNSVPQGAEFPYIELSTPTEIPFHTFGARTGSWGGRVTIETLVASRYRGDKECSTVLDAVKRRLEAASLVVPNFFSCFVQFETSTYYSNAESGVVTRYAAGIFAVTVHESD